MAADGGTMGDFHPSLRSTGTAAAPVPHWLPFPTGPSRHNIPWPFPPSRPAFFSTLVFWDPSALGHPPLPQKNLNTHLFKHAEQFLST